MPKYIEGLHYSFSTSLGTTDQDAKYGIYYYDRRVHLKELISAGPRSYRIKMKVSLYPFSYINTPFHLCINVLIDADLEEYISYESDSGSLVLNYESLFNQCCLNSLNKVHTRLLAIEAGQPDSLVCDGDSFLIFDEQSAHCWGTPFRVGEYAGACYELIIKQKNPDWTKCLNKRLFDLIDTYCLPDRHYLEEPISYKLFHSDEDYKRAIVDKLSDSEMIKVIEEITQNNPLGSQSCESQRYRIHMFGTDDCSYSKWFSTQEDLDAEVVYLKNMQPLDMYSDITERGYIFTN